MFLHQQKQASWCPDQNFRRKILSRGRIPSGRTLPGWMKNELLHFSSEGGRHTGIGPALRDQKYEIYF
ncbi:hypothetical protein A3A09_02505 [Candidatus Nomurabacteria bacterium RIFCSPLOWO2_01_FULL_42_20]|nr:MAG: hypothetical protein A3A09_02505 [Candidatus Nomurabacteria bacterium RIFCSPLOWO2_01_FULL_42_20]